MMAVRIPNYRLPKDILHYEIGTIERTGQLGSGINEGGAIEDTGQYLRYDLEEE